MDVDTTDIPVVKVSADSAGQKRIRIEYGELTLRLNVPEAVDLVDGVAAALAEVDATVEREIRRDGEAVRQDAEVREALNG